MSDINDVKKNLNVIIEELISHDSEEEWFEFKENWYEPVDAQVKYKNAQVNAQVKVNKVLDETQNYDFSIEEKALQFCSEAKSIIELSAERTRVILSKMEDIIPVGENRNRMYKLKK